MTALAYALIALFAIPIVACCIYVLGFLGTVVAAVVTEPFREFRHHSPQVRHVGHRLALHH